MNEAALRSFRSELEKDAATGVFKKIIGFGKKKFFPGIGKTKAGKAVTNRVIRPAKILAGTAILSGTVVGGGALYSGIKNPKIKNPGRVRGRYSF